MTDIYKDETSIFIGTNNEFYSVEVLDDGSYFDEVILNAWVDDYGAPIAGCLLKSIRYAMPVDGNRSAFLDKFFFINGENFSMDTLKRISSGEMVTYALILTNVLFQKY